MCFLLCLQLVAGYKYVITVRMAKSQCRKGTSEQVCQISEDPEIARVTT